MDSIPVTIYCRGPQGDVKKRMLARLVQALAQRGLLVGVLCWQGDTRPANSDDIFVSAGAVTHADECDGTIVIASGSEPDRSRKDFFSDCHILLIDTERCDGGSVAVLDIRPGFFCGYGLESPDAADMAERIQDSILHTRISAAVLAGGCSSRLGRNKALLPLDGKTVIEKVVDEARCCVGAVTIITNSPDAYAHLGCPCCGDVLPGGGALSGIHAALTHCGTEYVLVVSCDIPLVNRKLFQELITALPGYDIVIFKHKHFEPLCALYRRTCLPALEDLIAHGEYRIIDLFPTLRVKVIRRGSADVFKNINTDADYASVKNASSVSSRSQNNHMPQSVAASCGIREVNSKP